MLRFSVALLALALTACSVKTDVMRLDTTPRQEKRPVDVQVLLETPSRPHRIIAMIEATDQGWGLGLEKIKAGMVARAAKLGGDAVIIGGRTTTDAGTAFLPIGNAVFGVPSTATNLQGAVIVFEGTSF